MYWKEVRVCQVVLVFIQFLFMTICAIAWYLFVPSRGSHGISHHFATGVAALATQHHHYCCYYLAVRNVLVLIFLL